MYKAHLKVRTYECDLYGHVNNATYLNYLEYARMEYLYSKGYSLESLKERGVMAVVVRVDIQYKKPAFPGDELEIEVRPANYRNTSGTFFQKIIRKGTGELIAEAEVTWVFTNLRGKPIPIPDYIKVAFDMDNQ
ncbi:MAG: thioesterase family protein [Calditrichia bacterium]